MIWSLIIMIKMEMISKVMEFKHWIPLCVMKKKLTYKRIFSNVSSHARASYQQFHISHKIRKIAIIQIYLERIRFITLQRTRFILARLCLTKIVLLIFCEALLYYFLKLSVNLCIIAFNFILLRWKLGK